MALSLNISSTDYSVLYLPQSLTDAEKAQVRENIGVAEEKDPTVPSWAKQQNKPTYTAAEVGALPDTTVIPTVPTNISDFVNDAGYAKTVDVVTNVNGQTGDVQTHLTVTIAANEDGTYTSSHTPQEIYAATQAGVVVEASDANGKRYSLYTCNEKGAQFLTMGVRGSSGKRILYTESFVISSNKVGKGTTETPIPVASVPMVGATGTAAGTAGLVPAPAKGDNGKFLRGDGTWREIGADESGAASDAVSSHNVNTSAHTDIREQISQLNSDKADKTGLTLGVHTDGLVYLFVNGSPQGNGLDIKAEVVEGDVFGYIDENNNIVLNGNLVEGTYTIKYEMEDGSLIDIGNLELDNSVYYTITNNLTNCTNGNIGITSVSAGDDYIAVINPVDNTEITSITVTMGGKDITASAVIFNPACLVEILGVTGDVVITAVAEEKIVATNFFKASPTVNTLANASQDALVIAGRMGSDNGYRVDAGPQALLTNYIEVQNGDEIVIRNATLQITYSGLFDSMAATKAIAIFNPSTTTSGIVSNISSTGFTIDNASAKYVRICLKPDASIEIDSSATTVVDKYDCSQIIVNIKRNGEWLTDNEAGPTNLLPLAVNANGSDYIGDNGEDGYNTGYKLRSSTGEEEATTGACVSGYIPATLYSRIYIKNIGVSSSASINNITLHNADKTRLFGAAGVEGAFSSYVDVVNDVYSFTPSAFISDNSVAFFRFSCGEITDETIVTVNEEIISDDTNLADPTSADWAEGYRLSISGGGTSALAGHTTTNFIPCKSGDILRVKGLWMYDPTNNTKGDTSCCKVVIYNSSKGKITGLYGSMAVAANNTYGTKVSINGDIQTYTILIDSEDVQRATPETAYLRIDGKLMDGYTANDVIITINKEIKD